RELLIANNVAPIVEKGLNSVSRHYFECLQSSCTVFLLVDIQGVNLQLFDDGNTQPRMKVIHAVRFLEEGCISSNDFLVLGILFSLCNKFGTQLYLELEIRDEVKPHLFAKRNAFVEFRKVP